LQLAFDKTGDDAVSIGNILLAKPHDIRRAGCLIVLGLSECRIGSHGQRNNGQRNNDKYELFHESPCAYHSTLNLCVSSTLKESFGTEGFVLFPLPVIEPAGLPQAWMIGAKPDVTLHK
jgi:hypothetical protein